MKKSLLIGALLLGGLALTSCNNDSSEPTSTVSNVIPTYNLFTDPTGSQAPFVGIGNYNYTMTYPETTATIMVSSMPVPGGSNISFTTDPVPFKVYYWDMDNDKKAEVVDLGSGIKSSNPAVSDIKCILSQAAYAPAEVKVPGFADRFVPSSLFHFTLMHYYYNNWFVRTFWPDMTFRGTTTTSGPGMDSAFESNLTSYRVVMQRNDDNSLKNKADLIMYNASFAQNMPPITIVVKDLDLAFNNNGYEITGTNVVPYMIESDELQLTPKFTFDNIKLSVTGDLTSMTSQFTVAHVFKGLFIGQSIKQKI